MRIGLQTGTIDNHWYIIDTVVPILKTVASEVCQKGAGNPYAKAAVSLLQALAQTSKALVIVEAADLLIHRGKDLEPPPARSGMGGVGIRILFGLVLH